MVDNTISVYDITNFIGKKGLLFILGCKVFSSSLCDELPLVGLYGRGSWTMQRNGKGPES